MKAKMARKLAMLVAMNGLLSNSESKEIESEISELERLANIGEKAESARKQVNNAIYFDGNSDYVPFLREICKILGMDDEKIGKEYLED